MTDKTNAKDELIEFLQEKPQTKCATITKEGYKTKIIDLKINYSETDWDIFLSNMNFDYDAECGMQEIYGFIWLEDGTWCLREELDGSEWWAHRKLPQIPKRLLK